MENKNEENKKNEETIEDLEKMCKNANEFAWAFHCKVIEAENEIEKTIVLLNRYDRLAGYLYDELMFNYGKKVVNLIEVFRLNKMTNDVLKKIDKNNEELESLIRARFACHDQMRWYEKRFNYFKNLMKGKNVLNFKKK